MKIWNKNVCLTSGVSIMIIFILLFSTIGLAKILHPLPKVTKIKKILEKPWEPTKEDIAFQTEMYAIIEKTQLDLDTIRAGIDKILYKLERFDYPDGTYDSIRYIVGGKIDKRRNK
jgi:hypothetical protein|tara:strand:+ start:560 stop:907 length:348 start_codon:yes stop_codon:yes gene_type:complete